jgi:hypothetical protein
MSTSSNKQQEKGKDWMGNVRKRKREKEMTLSRIGSGQT